MTSGRDATHPRFPDVRLTSGGVTLRPLRDDDVRTVTEYAADPLVQKWLPLPNPYTEQAARWFCTEFATGQLASGQGIVRGIEVAGAFAGAIDLKHTDWAARSTEIGYWLAPWARGRGVVRAAVAALARWALTEMSMERVKIRVATGNVASQRVALAASFLGEGLLRNAGYVHGGRVDLFVYSQIPSDLAG